MIKINNKSMQKVIESRIEESARTISRLVLVLIQRALLDKKLITKKDIINIIDTEVSIHHIKLKKDFAVYKNKIKEEFISNQVFKLLEEKN